MVKPDALQDIMRGIGPADRETAARAKKRHDTLTKPPGSLGGLEALGVRLASIYGAPKPVVRNKAVAVFAADHGVTAAGVSAYPKGVTRGMVLNFLHGGAAVNALARVADAGLLVVDVGVDADFPDHPRLLKRKVARGTANFLDAPAMTMDETLAACNVGVETSRRLISEGANLLVGGEMGIGNTTPAAALTAVLTGGSVRAVTGRGTGVTDAGLEHKITVIERVLERHQPERIEPLGTLAKVGGLEIAALVGFYLMAARERVPVVLDGFIATSAALVAVALNAHVRDYLFASHASVEPGHRVQLGHLGLEPLFDFGLRLGEGSGGVLALPLLESAARVLTDMATFEEAGLQ